jgi:hypothetical protein
MILPVDNRIVEGRILAELAEIDAKIRDLTVEKNALARFLGRVRQDGLGSVEVTRKNSYSRIVIESRILSALKEEGPMRTSFLLIEARLVHHGLKDGTFRSYLHRLQQRGLIVPAPMRPRGYWTLPEQPPSSTK